MEKNIHIKIPEYSDPIASFCVLLGKNGVHYLDYSVIVRLYQIAGENPYLNVN